MSRWDGLRPVAKERSSNETQPGRFRSTRRRPRIINSNNNQINNNQDNNRWERNGTDGPQRHYRTQRTSRWIHLRDQLRTNDQEDCPAVEWYASVLEQTSSMICSKVPIRRDDPVGEILLWLLDNTHNTRTVTGVSATQQTEILALLSKICRDDNDLVLKNNELGRLVDMLTVQQQYGDKNTGSDNNSTTSTTTTTTTTAMHARISSLCSVVYRFCETLPAEQTAAKVLDGTFIPFLLSAPLVDSNRDDNASAQHRVLEATEKLLRQTHHTSAVLSPLTLEVTSDGTEQTEENPIGRRLVEALEQNLPLSCRCFTSLFETYRKLGGNIRTGIPIRLDRIEAFFFRRYNQEQSSRTAADIEAPLEMLAALLRTNPDAVVPLRSIFLGTSVPTVASDKRSTSRGHGNYPSGESVLLDRFYYSEQRCQPTEDCIVLFLQHLPIRQWMAASVARGAMHILRTRLLSTFKNLLTILGCSPSSMDRNKRHAKETLIPSLRVLTECLHTIPATSEFRIDDLLMELWSKLASSLTDDEPSNAIRDCFIRCLGGQPRPDGGHTTTSHSLSLWLSRSASHRFQSWLWESASFIPYRTNPKSIHSKQGLSILGALLRVRPWTATESKETFLSLRQAIEQRLSRTVREYRKEAMGLLLQFLIGRSMQEEPAVTNSTVVGEHQVSTFVLESLQQSIIDDNSGVRLVSLQAYSSLVAEDWKHIFTRFTEDCQDTNKPTEGQNDATIMQDPLSIHLDAVVSRCAQGNSAAERAAAYKAVGDITSRVFEALDSSSSNNNNIDGPAISTLSELCREVARVVECGILPETSATVRSMVSAINLYRQFVAAPFGE